MILHYCNLMDQKWPVNGQFRCAMAKGGKANKEIAMKYAVLFTDTRDAAPDIRKKHMRAHLDFLLRNHKVIEAAGPLSDPEGKGHDGLWIVEVETPEAVEVLIREDPFWPTGLRASYAILPWRQVFAAGQQLIDPL